MRLKIYKPSIEIKLESSILIYEDPSEILDEILEFSIMISPLVSSKIMSVREDESVIVTFWYKIGALFKF